MSLLNKSILVLIIFSSLSVNAQNQASEKSFNILLKQFDQYVGVKVPNCELIDENGNSVNLHEINCKLMVMDFWASWCVNCIRDFPESLKLYEKLIDNGFDSILWISISVDQDTVVWKKTISRLEVPGRNFLLNIESAKEDFHINEYPTYILLDEEKRILGFEIPSPHEGSYMEYFICKAFEGQTVAESFKKAIDIRDGFCYSTQYYNDWKEAKKLTQ